MESRAAQVTDINPFDSFSARLRVAQQRAKPAQLPCDPQDSAAAAVATDPQTIGVRLWFRRRGTPRAGEPFEALTDLQRDAGQLDADGSVRLRVPLSAPTVTVSVGANQRFRIVLAISRDQQRGA